MLPPSDVDPDLQRLKWLLVNATLDLKLDLLARAIKAGFNPDQPRDELGRWADGSGSLPTRANTPSPREHTLLAQYSFGTLIGQARILGGGRNCFYKFGFGIVMVPGSPRFGCSQMIPAAAAIHGVLIANEN